MTTTKTLKAIKISAANWSGRETVVRYIEETGEFTIDALEGMRFELRLSAKSEVDGFESWALIDRDDDEHVMGFVHRFENEPEFYASVYGCFRTHENRFAAAAQVLLNII